MEEIPKENIVDKIYKLRKNFVVIGLTGRTGSGCSTVAKLLSTQNPEEFKSEYREVNSSPIDNDVRKNRIIYRYILKNWSPFTIIKASDIIFYYALLQTFDDFSGSLAKCSNDANSEGKFSDSDSERSREIQNDLQKVKSKFEELSAIARECDNFLEKDEIKDNRENTSKYLELILKGIPNFRDELGKALEKSKRILSDELQTWGNNIRVYDSIIVPKDRNQSENAPSCLARKINQFLKLIRYDNEIEGKPTLIAIDALRNPYEVLYFRERYSAFYLMSINTTEQIRKQKLFEQGYRNDEIALLDKREGEKKDFKSQYTGLDIDKCIELSDIHITHDGTEYTNNRKLTNQIITYISLMLHPGLVPPSPIERVMQVAYTANYYWNAGIFVWNIDTISKAIRTFQPQLASIMDEMAPSFYTEQEKEVVGKLFPTCEKISIDYAVMEKSKEIFTLPAEFGWSDLGSWGSLRTLLPQDEAGNAKVGKDIRLYECKNCVVHAVDESKVVVQGLDGYIVAEKNRQLLVCSLKEEQRIKDFGR